MMKKNKITSGSASLNSTVYDKNNIYKLHQEILERFEKVIWISKNRREGIFYNDERCLVGTLKTINSRIKA